MYNRRAMETFLASVEKRAFKMAQIATGSTDDALDIVQDAMLGLVKQYGSKPVTQLKPLFFRILTTRIKDWHRRKSVRNRWRLWLFSKKEESLGCDPIEALADPDENNPADRLIISDTRSALESALKTLPFRQQQAFMLRAWEELSVRKTAFAMKCSEGTVKTHYSRAVHGLRKLLESHRS